jgi:hypothetical protein
LKVEINSNLSEKKKNMLSLGLGKHILEVFFGDPIEMH